MLNGKFGGSSNCTLPPESPFKISKLRTVRQVRRMGRGMLVNGRACRTAAGKPVRQTERDRWLGKKIEWHSRPIRLDYGVLVNGRACRTAVGRSGTLRCFAHMKRAERLTLGRGILVNGRACRTEAGRAGWVDTKGRVGRSGDIRQPQPLHLQKKEQASE